MRYDPEIATKPKRPHNPWTSTEDLILLNAKENGLSYTEVLDQLPGRSRSSVAGRYARMKVKALPPEERVARRKEAEAKYPRKPRPPQRQNGGRPKKPPVLSEQTPLPREVTIDLGSPRRSTAKASLLPHVMTKQGTLLHVYARHPHVLEPLATFEKRSSFWVKRGDPTVRFTRVQEAVRAMESPW